MARVRFTNIGISAIATTVGDKEIFIDDEQVKFGFDEKTLRRLKKTIGLGTRFVVDSSVCTSDLCVQSAESIFDSGKVDKDEIDAVLFVTQSPDYRAPSTAIIVQNRLKLGTDVVAYDINLGCSGFVYGLYTAFSMVNSGLNKVLLLVGDVNHYFTQQDRSFTPLMGDAGGAIVIERMETEDSFFVMHSDGSGYEHLIIPDGGARKECTEDSIIPTLQDDGCIRRGCDLYMNGAEVFNFAVKTVPKLLDELFEYGSFDKDDVDYFVLHQANSYILKNISNSLGLGEDKLPFQTGLVYGNQNSASIPGTISGFLNAQYSEKKLTSVFAGFGIGLSWAACKVNTDNIFSPKVQFYKEKNE